MISVVYDALFFLIYTLGLAQDFSGKSLPLNYLKIPKGLTK